MNELRDREADDESLPPSFEEIFELLDFLSTSYAAPMPLNTYRSWGYTLRGALPWFEAEEAPLYDYLRALTAKLVSIRPHELLLDAAYRHLSLSLFIHRGLFKEFLRGYERAFDEKDFAGARKALDAARKFAREDPRDLSHNLSTIEGYDLEVLYATHRRDNEALEEILDNLELELSWMNEGGDNIGA